MSIFRTVEVPCPSCGNIVPFELVHSVNAGRRPDLRRAILDRSFQKQPCPACGTAFRVEPEFAYTDLGRGQFIAVWPASQLENWAEIETRSQSAFDAAFGSGSTSEAQAIGRDLKPRAVFGWAGLNEKLIAADAAIDDVTLELAKLALFRTLDSAPLGGGSEFRYIGPEGDNLLFGWIQTATEDLTEVISAPKTLLDEIDAAPADWQPLREELSAGLFVDYRRMLAGA